MTKAGEGDFEMNKAEIIKLAREAGLTTGVNLSGVTLVGAPVGVTIAHITIDEMQHFAALVAAAERDRMISEGWRQCAQGQKTSQFCAAAEQVRREEREKCAKVCDARYMGDNNREDMEARRCAEAIRASGQE